MKARKKGSTRFRSCGLILFLACGASLFLPRGTAAQLDTLNATKLRSQLKRAAAEYERALRRLAPRRLSGSSGRNCDEIVGRFCLTYDVGRPAPLPPEPEEVKRVRSATIEVFQRAARTLPRDTSIAAPLIRYLIEDGRAEEAVREAEAYAQGHRNEEWSSLLLGFAMHYDQRITDAEDAFERALAQMSEKEARRARDVYYLLHPAERSVFKRMADSAQARYLDDYWRISDPLYLTAGNETRTEHFARYVYARILARAPVVLGSVSWGDDLEELTRRFGVPAARTQNWGTGLDMQITEHFDPEQLTYAPPRLSKERLLAPPLPGAPWPFDTVAERNGFAPKTVRAMRVLEHQLSRFPGTTPRLRVDLQMRLDSLVEPGSSVEVAFFAGDSLLNVLAETRDTIAASDTIVIARLEMDVPEGATLYSVEAREIGTHLSARARYELPTPNGALPAVSDLVLLHGRTEPAPRRRGDPGFVPLSTLVIDRDQPLALYLEVLGLSSDANEQARYRIDLEVVPANQPGAVARALKGLGRRLGFGSSVVPRITWTQTDDGKGGIVPVLLQIGSLKDKNGLQTLRVTVTDLLSGAWSTAQRTVRVRRD